MVGCAMVMAPSLWTRASASMLPFSPKVVDELKELEDVIGGSSVTALSSFMSSSDLLKSSRSGSLCTMTI